MKKLVTVVLGALLVLVLTGEAQAARFHMSITVRTSKPQTVLVRWHARCYNGNVNESSWGRYRVQTPTTRNITPPLLDATGCTLYAHVWNLTGQGEPHLKIRVTP